MAATETRMGATGLEVRDAEDGQTVTLSGYASTFNQPYDMGFYRETVAPGAFARTLGRKPDVRLLVNHDGLPLARTTSGTLELREDSTGLLVEARLDANDPDVASLIPKMKRGDLSQMSFGFRIDGKDGQEWSDDRRKRTLKSLDLNDGDVSIVTYPANPSTTAALRAATFSLEPLIAALADVNAKGADPLEARRIYKRFLKHIREAGYLPDPETALEVAPELGDLDREALLATERRIAEIRALIA